MTNILLVALVQVSALGADQQDFDQAYHRSRTTGRPLLVLVGAGWCPACQKMRHSILPGVAGVGGLSKVVFTYVDFDQQRRLASRLSRGTSIPQLIRFDQTPAGWKSKRLIGAKSPRQVYDFINAGLIDQSKASGASVRDRPGNDPHRSAPKKSVRSSPVGSRSGAYSSRDALAGGQREVASSRVEQVGGVSDWIALLKKLFPKSRNPRDSAVHEHNRSSQPREHRGAGQSPGPREVGAAGSASGGGGGDVAASLSALVSGSTVSRRNSFKNNHLRQD